MSTQSLRVTTLAALTLLSTAAAVTAGDNHFRVRPDDAELRVRPDVYPEFRLPRFGMMTYNNGFGEKVVRVRYGGLADQLGLERGDTIVRMNNFRLNYEGAWSDALRSAMQNGGHIVLKVRNVRTGGFVTRHTDIDPYGYGPEITPKFRSEPRIVNRNIGGLRWED
ncbi:MAG: hypothetical protein KDA37_14385 [Planctomycetales bacterium]|nr:hypothetical protein [Planctomycetales bacterium]